jgi:galactoside 2-L-fucosyltransferase 1/2
VLAKAAGRLGNHMFVYATLLGIAVKNNMTPIFYKGYQPLKDTFRSLVAIENVRLLGSNTSVNPSSKVEVLEISNWIYDNRFELLHTLSASEVHIGTYLQSWKYFSHIEPEIRSQFTFKESYVRISTDYLREETAKNG